MTEVYDINNLKKEYDTNINVIGSIKDCNIIHKSIVAYFSDSDSIKDLIIDRNELDVRTEKSRLRIARAIETSFLTFANAEHEELINKLYKECQNIGNKNLILFWQFAFTNKLFYDITSKVFIKTYFSGRTSLPSDDITAYLKNEIKEQNFGAIAWSESTINIISSKYLNFLTKLGLLEGTKNKQFKHIQLSSEALLIFLHFAKLYSPDCSNLLNNDFLPLSFISKEQMAERVRKLAKKGLLDMSFDGVALKIELPVDIKGDNNVLRS